MADGESEQARILLVDDEEPFLRATSGLLAKEGFQCDCAPDGPRAAEMLGKTEYDLIIADINMPGNTHLELIRELPKLAPGVPAILVTGYPSMKSAVSSIQLPVIAYVLKPFDYDEFLGHVRTGIRYAKGLRSVKRTRLRLEDWLGLLSELEEGLQRSPGSASHVPIATFLSLKMQHVYGALADIQSLASCLTDGDKPNDACYLLDCQPRRTLIDTLKETVKVLAETKGSFKSKQLEALRVKLEAAIEEAERARSGD